jgi:hypothetical protein
MTFLKLSNVANVPNVGWLALLAAMAGTASNACSNTPPPAEQAFVSAVIGPGTLQGVDDAPACGQGDLAWQLGSPVSPQPVVYADGSSQAGGAVHINCSVDPSGSGYTIQLAAELDGMMAGTLIVTGTVGATGMSTGLTGTFTTEGQTFRDTNCTFTQTYNESPLPANGQPAQGRVWGHIDCPHAQDLGQEGLGGDGGEITRTCDASADFLFDNCE